MKKETNYKLVSKDVPLKKSKVGFYREIVDEFLQSKAPSALVEFEIPRNIMSAYGSFNAVKNYYEPNTFKVCLRSKEIYLVKVK
jgi:hypothetical protein